MSVSGTILQPHNAATEHWLLLGICGAGMSNLCQLLQASGQQVSGSDTDADRLQMLAGNSGPWQRQVSVIPWDQLRSSDFHCYSRVVRSLAVPPDLPTLAAAAAAGCVIRTLPEALAECCRGASQVCVAGTHGKTTTTGMLWWLLHHCGQAAGRYVGGDFQLQRQPEHVTSPATMIVESCEYRDSFLTLSPQLAVLTGIEPDHLDWFPDRGAMLNSYCRFLAGLPSDGLAIVNSDCPAACAAVRRTIHRKVAVGRTSAGGTAEFAEFWDYTAADLPTIRRGSGLPGQHLRLRHSSGEELLLRLAVPGRHNALNAALAVAAGCELGLSPSAAAAALANFPGMQRRLEFRGTWRGADLFDDYAHHPTAVAAVLSTLRASLPGQRILAVFEPHQCSRLRGLMTEFAAALQLADELIVLPALRIREKATVQDAALLSGNLVQLVRNLGGQANLVSDLDHVAGILDYAVRPGDIVITMGAGRTNTIHDQIHRRIQRDSAA